jgi:hypothetical protein
MNIIFNGYLLILVTTMVVAMIGVPAPMIGKRSEVLSKRMGWANAAIVFAVALALAVTR